MLKVVIKISQGSVVTQTRVRWANYISSSCKFPIAYYVYNVYAAKLGNLVSADKVI